MASRAEMVTSASLRRVLAPVPIGGSIENEPDYQELLSALEAFISEILAQRYPHWQKWESLDGVYPALARKTANREAELGGVCILIEDQCWTPFHVRFGHSESRDEIEWMRCRVGAPGTGHGGLLRIPHDKLPRRYAQQISDNPDDVDWVYTAGLGEV